MITSYVTGNGNGSALNNLAPLRPVTLRTRIPVPFPVALRLPFRARPPPSLEEPHPQRGEALHDREDERAADAAMYAARRPCSVFASRKEYARGRVGRWSAGVEGQKRQEDVKRMEEEDVA